MKRYNYKLIADAFAITHAGLILLAIAAIPLLLIVSWFKYVTIIILVVVVISWIVTHDCLLRKWENDFRFKHEPETVYEGAFIAHYVMRFTGMIISRRVVRTFVYTLAGAIAVETLYCFCL